MTFLTFDALLITSLFLVPGYIWSSVHALLVPRRSQETQIRLLEFLTLSCVNHAVWWWLFALLFATGFYRNHPAWVCVILILPALISPVLFGILSGRVYQRDWLRKALGRLGFRTLHQIPTAWDFQFSRLLPFWVIVTLKDGSSVYGLYGYHSFASDDPKERDLYLEATFTLREDGEWLPVDSSAGILIQADEIAAIAFRRYEEATDGNA